MNSDITLRKVGEPQFNDLPRNVKALILGDRIVFVKWNRLAQIFMPLPQKEQIRLTQEHVSYHEND